MYLNALNPGNTACMREALSLGTQGNFDSALEKIRRDPSIEAEFIRGVSYLNLGRRRQALAAFRKVVIHPRGNFLAPAFCDYIAGKQTEAAKMYGGTEFSKYFQAASGTPIFENMHRAVDNTLQYQPNDSDTFTIVDLGIGSAKQVGRILGWIPEKWPHVRKVHVIGVEPYEHMAKLAKENMARHIMATPLQVRFDLVPRFSQELDERVIHDLLEGRDLDAVNACAAIHHMPQTDKIRLLKVIKNWQPKIFIVSDGDSNHESDIPDMSFELIANVYSFYSTMLAYMMSGCDDPELLNLYKGFCFYDGRNVLVETGAKRIEFHTLAKRWIEYAREVGFRIVSPKKEWLAGIAHNKSKINSEYLVTAFHDRPICFQLTMTT